MDTKDRHLMHAALFAAALAALPPALPAEPAGPPAPAPLAATRWTADVSDARPFQARVMRGASHLLEARFREGRDAAPIPDGSTASMLWQTNGMGSAWWSAPATVESNAVSAVWTPEMDCGAPLYRAFLRVDAPGGADYSAFATLLMLDSPGAVPNELPPPVRSIDFARVAVTNAPWATPAEVAEAVAAATNAIPQPDLSAYLRKSGGTMTGTLNAPWVHLAQGTVKLDLDPIELRFENGTAIGRNMIKLYGQNGDRVEITPSYGFELIRAGQQYGDIFNWPSKMGTLALLEDIPPAPTPTPVYADPAPWSISVARVAPVGYEESYAVTNLDLIEEWLESGSYSDVQCSIAVEDRPASYAYEAPTGTWSIASDDAGAASGISRDGYVAASRSASGTVIVEYSTPSNGSRRAAVWIAQETEARRVSSHSAAVPGTPRHEWGTNLLARLAAIDYSGPAHTYANPYSTKVPEVIVDALALYSGFTQAVPATTNETLFWPELARAFACESIARTDLKGVGGQPVLAIAPHWGVSAKHFGNGPSGESMAFREPDTGEIVKPGVAEMVGNPANDIRLVRFASAIPSNCIARLVAPETPERLSATGFDHAAGITLTQHNTVAPFAIGWRGWGETSASWDIQGYAAATNAAHAAHVGDSGHVYGMVTPEARLIPFGLLQSVNGGPALTAADNQAWIAAHLAATGEEITFWTYEELAGNE